MQAFYAFLIYLRTFWSKIAVKNIPSGSLSRPKSIFFDINYSLLWGLIGYFPAGLRLIPMDAQWMLKGYSMVASYNLGTLSLLAYHVKTLFLQNSLQRYNFFFKYPNFEPPFCLKNDIYVLFTCVSQLFVVPLHANQAIDEAIQSYFSRLG